MATSNLSINFQFHDYIFIQKRIRVFFFGLKFELFLFYISTNTNIIYRTEESIAHGLFYLATKHIVFTKNGAEVYTWIKAASFQRYGMLLRRHQSINSGPVHSYTNKSSSISLQVFCHINDVMPLAPCCDFCTNE